MCNNLIFNVLLTVFWVVRHLKAILCGWRRFKYPHPKCATFTRIAVKAKKIGI
jgi:hypothetical protein